MFPSEAGSLCEPASLLAVAKANESEPTIQPECYVGKLQTQATDSSSVLILWRMSELIGVLSDNLFPSVTPLTLFLLYFSQSGG